MTLRIQIVFGVLIILAILVGYFLGDMFGLWPSTGEIPNA